MNKNRDCRLLDKNHKTQRLSSLTKIRPKSKKNTKSGDFQQKTAKAKYLKDEGLIITGSRFFRHEDDAHINRESQNNLKKAKQKTNNNQQKQIEEDAERWRDWVQDVLERSDKNNVVLPKELLITRPHEFEFAEETKMEFCIKTSGSIIRGI